jgi:alkylation response protein AidB-like acyl-CoA dehydrogenase
MSLLNHEHEAVRAAAREFVAKAVLPIADRLDRAGQEIPDPIIRQLGELGYLGMTVPLEYDGVGMDHLSMAIVAEELSRGWLSVGSVMTRNLITSSLLLAHGTDQQKRRWLPGLATGAILSAVAFTEPNVGSDTAGIQLRARREGASYILHGAKTWCSFANRAHLLAVLARTDPDQAKRHKGLSIFLVEKQPGDAFAPPQLTGEPIPTIGYHGMRSFSLSFDELAAPSDSLLGGEEGRGFYQLMATYEAARIQTAARAVGVAQAALEAACAYAQQREQFGQPIAQFQVIRHKLAHMATEVEAARRLTYYAATLKDQGARCDMQAGMAKLFAAEMVERVTSEGLQIFGGYGYSQEFPAQRFWRDGRLFRIFEGTSEIQAEIIAKRLLGS